MEHVRYIRRRKFGQKRRSILVKRRTPMKNHSLKNDSMITNEDSCTNEFIYKDDDERSQEYIPRRRISMINELIKEKTIEEEEEEDTETVPVSSSPKVTIRQPVFKQLKLDQFLQPDATLTSDETNHCQTESNNDDEHLHTRRITRHTRLHSTSQPEIENPILSSELNNDEGSSLLSSNDSSLSTNLQSSSISNIDRPIPLKRRSLTASNIQALIDEACSPPKVSFTLHFVSNQFYFQYSKDLILESN